ncbi:Ribosomal protein S18 acetylase RimI [Apiospora phragmitis]|uniref:Ribosomal protein S18 acetylase RimI n=1 Tax=Apiospora phragmitis TaxID=2905665 RepID=A0ABR1X7J8_9PEZI
MDQPQPPSTVPQLAADTVVPASTVTPVPEATKPPPPAAGQQQTRNITIEIAADADDDALVAALTGIVNQVYFDTESDIFLEGVQRTDEQEVRSIIQAGELAVVYLLSSPEHQSTSSQQQQQNQRKAIGCIRIRRVSSDVGELGMMAITPSHHGGGMGSALVRFAEGHARLQAWYERLGYQVVRLGVFHDEYPKIAALLAGRPSGGRICNIVAWTGLRNQVLLDSAYCDSTVVFW